MFLVPLFLRKSISQTSFTKVLLLRHFFCLTGTVAAFQIKIIAELVCLKGHRQCFTQLFRFFCRASDSERDQLFSLTIGFQSQL